MLRQICNIHSLVLIFLIAFDQMLKHVFINEGKKNFGIFYSCFDDWNMQWWIVCLSILLFTCYLIFMHKQVFLDIFFAGVLSNALDRAVRGYVVDIYYLPFVYWFNLADVYIWVLSGFVYLISRICSKKERII